MSSSEKSPAEPRRAAWRRDQRGSALIEFALVAPIFFALLFAILEIALTFFAGQVLENGLDQTARKMFTHEAADTNMTRDQFVSDLCDRVKVLMDCSKLRVNVSITAPGNAITILNPIDGGTFVDSFNYQNPQAQQTVVVSAYYLWPLVVTQLGFNMANVDSNTPNGKYLLSAMAAFRVEPGAR
ncbi:MAG: pilus assembly protein [Xanthobacteraceae bacterium]|nr:pilus assembly protein [Xanthobacteraceae bacterium]